MPLPRLISGWARAARRRLAHEHGVSLVEVMVSAVVLIMISMGVLGALDNASGASGVARAKSVATNLAQQDQDRLRTLKATQLSNLDETASRTISGVKYTIRSEGVWVSDATGSESCTSGSSSTDYLRISSTVTWGSAPRPVNVNSIFAPPNGSFGPNQGSAAVEVLDRADKGVEGIGVDLVGPPSFSDTTNGVGCAFFGFIPVGNSYRAKIDEPGYVDPDGNQLIDRQVSVPPEAVSTLSVRYDRAAAINATFDTNVLGVVKPAVISSLVLSNAGLTSGKRVQAVPAPGTSLATTNLFPFINPYAVYAGDCAAADPAAYRVTAALTPGANVAVTVRVPAIDLTAKKGGALQPNMTVKFKPTGAGCSTITRVTNALGRLDNPAAPYGTYDVCFQDGTSRVNFPNVFNSVPGGRRPIFDLSTTPPTAIATSTARDFANGPNVQTGMVHSGSSLTAAGTRTNNASC